MHPQSVQLRTASQTHHVCNAWPPTSSSNSSSDNSSPSSASGNYGAYRPPPSSHYYLQNFSQPKNNWEFMHHVQRQMHENCATSSTSHDMPNKSSAPSSSSVSSCSSNMIQGGGGYDQGVAYPGGSQMRGTRSEEQEGGHPSYYSNSLHYHQQQMLQLHSGA